MAFSCLSVITRQDILIQIVAYSEKEHSPSLTKAETPQCHSRSEVNGVFYIECLKSLDNNLTWKKLLHQ